MLGGCSNAPTLAPQRYATVISARGREDMCALFLLGLSAIGSRWRVSSEQLA